MTEFSKAFGGGGDMNIFAFRVIHDQLFSERFL